MSTAEHDQTKLGYIFVLVVQVASDRKLVKSLSRGGSSPRNGFVLPVNINFHLYCREGKPLPYGIYRNIREGKPLPYIPTHLQISIYRSLPLKKEPPAQPMVL